MKKRYQTGGRLLNEKRVAKQPERKKTSKCQYLPIVSEIIALSVKNINNIANYCGKWNSEIRLYVNFRSKNCSTTGL